MTRSLTPLATSFDAGASSPSGRGRHRAVRPAGRGRRAAIAALAITAPIVPGALLAAPAHAETDWDKLAQCESSGNWSTDTGNGFSGGLQFTPSTWKAFGGSGNAEDASREEQIQGAEKVKAAQGMNAWPTCSQKTGQTSGAANSGSSDSSSSDDSSASGEAPATTKAPAKKAVTEKKAAPKRTEKKAAVSEVSSSSPKSSGGGDYTVKAGDTLSSIASSQGVSGGWDALRSANTDVISDPNMIFPGQTLSMG